MEKLYSAIFYLIFLWMGYFGFIFWQWSINFVELQLHSQFDVTDL